jgi:hypothetical protein
VWWFALIHVLATDLVQRTEIRLLEVPNREYSLRLFVDNVQEELREKNLDTSPTPVCPLGPLYVHSVNPVHV